MLAVNHVVSVLLQQYQVPVYTVPDATLPQVPEVQEAVMGAPIAEELSRTKD